tara:strand:+ start:68 stop:517 length:450 start_codon:yes stop_codon:yes gene_type:complete
MRNKIFAILTLFLFYGCEDTLVGLGDCWGCCPVVTHLDIYISDIEPDTNGYYHIEYDNVDYHQVNFTVNPPCDELGRVYWNSPDTFSVFWQFQEFEQAIINYSTYADNYGMGQQMFHLDNTQVGDTLMIFGYVSEDVWDYLYFIVEDNE